MNDAARVLLIADDEATAEFFRATFRAEMDVELVVATSQAGLRTEEYDAVPDLVVIDSNIRGCDPFRLNRRLAADTALSDALRVLIVDPGSSELKLAGLDLGVHDFLTRPLERADVLAKLRWTRRLHQNSQSIRTDQVELRRLHEELRLGFERLLQLLVHLVDMRLPGAATRGERIAQMALMLAARSDVPMTMRRDLEIAARLHEIGRLLVAEAEPGGNAASASADGWQYVVATRTLLHQVDGLQDAADLVGAIYENWDGTGGPNHLNRGQIPFRSRILRVLIDLTAAVAAEPERPSKEILEALAEHQGTRYDPMVLVHLRELMEAGITPLQHDAMARVPITALQVGMVLAEDLCTDAGLKLLARRTVLTPRALEIIRRRHQLEPILEGAVVLTRPG